MDTIVLQHRSLRNCPETQQCSSGTAMKTHTANGDPHFSPTLALTRVLLVQFKQLCSAHCSQTAALKGRNCCTQIYCLRERCFKYPILNKLISKHGAALGFSLRQVRARDEQVHPRLRRIYQGLATFSSASQNQPKPCSPSSTKILIILSSTKHLLLLSTFPPEIKCQIA